MPLPETGKTKSQKKAEKKKKEKKKITLSPSEREAILKEGGIILDVLEGEFVEKPAQWVHHKRSTNYIARITGLDPKYGFARDFLDKVYLGKKTYFHIKDFDVGEVYEFRCIYYTGRGREDPRLKGLFICVHKGDDAVAFMPISEEDAVRVIKQKIGIETAEQEEAETEAKKLLKKIRTFLDGLQTANTEVQHQIEKLKKRIKKLEGNIKVLKEVKKVLKEREELEQKLREEIPEEKVEETRMFLEESVVRIAKNIFDAVGSGYSADFYFVDDKNNKHYILIKKENKRLYYVKIDNNYVWATFKKVDILTMIWGLRLLIKAHEYMKQKFFEQKIEEIKEAIKNVSISEEEKKKLEEAKQKVKEKLVDFALDFVRTFGKKKSGVYIFEGSGFKIKAKGKKLEYIKYAGSYIYGYGEGGIETLLKALNDLRRIYDEKKARIKSEA